ncbi:MAG: 50S ribosomal protein L29 [Legionellales bacterium RIFCSPHIGHO2_12_FULL_35_11]|nr:MAG: 50S ribosomal protein L29 [Legionellales bacterium RIFCSPHIGHO2_12_FULL_35_11]
MKTLEELRKMSIDELQAEVIVLRKNQFNLRLKKANGALDKTHVVGQVRKAIARVKTIIVEKADRHD